MSNLKLKQVDSSSAVVGGAVLYDGVTLVYTNNDDGAIQLPVGDNTARPTGVNGLLRYNSDADCIEGYVSGSWTCLSGTSVITVTTDPYNAQENEIILVNATSSAITVNLPTPVNGTQITIKKIDSSGNTVTIDGNGNTIDGSATQTIGTQFTALKLAADGNNWFIL